MIRILLFWLCCVLSAAAATPVQVEGGMEKHAARFARMYFAPMEGAMYFRLYDPSYGIVEFERVHGGDTLAAPGGWRGRAWKGGRSICVMPPVSGDQPPVEYHFDNGRPHLLKVGDRPVRVEIEDGAVEYSGPVPEMWKTEKGTGDDDPLKGKWIGRFSPFYRNPNRAGFLLASVSLVFLALLLRPPKRFRYVVVIGAGLLALVFLKMVLMTGSRGALLAFAAGVGVLSIICINEMRGRVRPVLFACLAMVGVVAVVAAILSGKLSAWVADPGNQLRFQILAAVPGMMVDAPWGWNILSPGFAYKLWYQDISSPHVTWTLVSGHLTTLVGMGWIGRFFWLFGWTSAIAVFFRLAWKGASALPCALWLAFSVAASFNPLLSSWTLWIIPVLSICTFVFTAKWNSLRGCWIDLLCCALLSGATLFLVWQKGSSTTPQNGIDLVVGRDSVRVKGENPDIWVVDDGESLGWLRSPLEIRFFYQNVTNAPPIGYAKSLSAVPKKVRRLVLAGEHCRSYLKAVRRMEAPSAREVYFISPPFGPSSMPTSLKRRIPATFIIGEFAARYVDVYGKPPYPPNVCIVPGAECYIPGWVGLSVED